MPDGIWQPIMTLPLDDGWSGRRLFGKMRDWGWEEWVGQVDAHEFWLGRAGDGTCFETDIPSHWMPLPPPPQTKQEDGDG